MTNLKEFAPLLFVTETVMVTRTGKLNALSPMAAKSQTPSVNDVVRLCDTHNIPIATNLATAELIVLAIDRGDLDWREMYK